MTRLKAKVMSVVEKASDAAAVKLFNRRLDDVIGEDLPILKKVKKFVISSGGKRIRPLVHFYLGRMSGYDGPEAVDVGAIGEIVHAASLLHDDVVDEASVRRGKPTIGALHGNKSAILSGDYLLACAFDHLQTLSRSRELIPMFTRVIRLLAVGELIQLESERDIRMPEATYERIILGKTASLFGAMSESAALLAGSHPLIRYRQFGERLGRLFQIRDDFLDYFVAESKTGKGRFQDFERGLVTRPVIVLRKSLSPVRRREIDKMWKSDVLRRDNAGRDRFLDLADSVRLREKLIREMEVEGHSLMHFVRSHPATPYREAILDQMRSLQISGLS